MLFGDFDPPVALEAMVGDEGQVLLGSLLLAGECVAEVVEPSK